MTHYDVIVIGSGAAGSVLAYRLARAGLSVLVLEKGAREDTATFAHNEFEMMPRLYKNAGLQTTVDNDIAILQGETVGGSTVINNAIWLRADLDRVLPSWAAHGAHVDRARLEHAYADLERALKVAPVPRELMNAGTDVFSRGCAALGLSVQGLSHNREACLGCGYCNYGCRYDRKTSMLVTFIPWAEARGARVIDQARDVRLIHDEGRVTSVEYTRFGRRYQARADTVTVCAGAIGSSELLLASRVRTQKRIGDNFHMLGGVLVVAEMEQRLDAFDRIGLTAIVGGTRDYVIETFFAPPAAFAVSLNGFAETHASRMQRYAYMAQAGVMVGTAPTGSIRLGKHGVEIRYELSATDRERLLRGLEQLVRIYLAAGAKAVYPALYDDVAITKPADLPLLQRVRRTEDLLFGSAHPQGGNVMSDDPRRGVVRSDFRVHGFANLFVADASVFPTNLWANCQATVMAMAYLAADSILRGRAEPATRPS